jgi:hypothetical protein
MQSRLPPITLLIGTNPQARNPEGVSVPAAGATDREILLSLSVRQSRPFSIIDSLQLTAKHKVATPVNWKSGEDVIIAGSVTDDDAKKQYPQGWKAPKPYLRIVPQPKV